MVPKRYEKTNPFRGVQFQVRHVSFFRSQDILRLKRRPLDREVRFVEGDNFPAEGSPEALEMQKVGCNPNPSKRIHSIQ